MEVEYSLTLEDLRAFRRFHIKKTESWRVWLIVGLLRVLLLTGLGFEGRDFLVRIDWITLLAVLGSMAGGVLLLLGILRWAEKRQYDKPENRWLFGSRRLAI